jgi:hypothetical protein
VHRDWHPRSSALAAAFPLVLDHINHFSRAWSEDVSAYLFSRKHSGRERRIIIEHSVGHTMPGHKV